MHDEGEKLFSKYVNVLLKDYDQKTIALNITIYNTHSTTPGHRRELYIRLTTADDLLFLQTLTLSEDDFQALKHQQGLLVDYAAFSQKFIDLLELCIEDQGSNSPRFILHLTTGCLTTAHGLLEVVETNPFKHLVHLSLKFVPGNDDEVKRYLAACLKQIKDEKELMQKQLSETERDLTNRLSNMQITLKNKIDELDSSKIHWQDKLTKVKEQYEVEMKKEKENSAKLRETYETRLQEESRSNGERYNHVVGDLETKLNATLASNKALTDQKYKYESLIRDLKSQVSSLEEEKQLKSKDVDKLRLQNHHLDSDRHERDKTLNHLKTRVAVLEQEVKNKDHVIKKTNQLMDSTNEQKNRVEVELEKKSIQITQLESSVDSVSAEVIKGNEIIKKLQMEIKSLKSRVKMMGLVTTKQEKLIEEKDLSLSHLNSEKSSQQKVINELRDEISKLNETVQESSQKLSESQETLKNNENVINWLNKQLNEYTISRSSHSSALRNSNISSTSSRVPHADRTVNSTNGNILPPNRPSTLSHNLHTSRSIVNMNNSGRNLQPKTTGHMPYDGKMFGKTRFQSENISPIVPQPRHPLREKQQNSTPVIHEEVEPILDAKYLMRRRTEKSNENAPLQCVISESEENVEPSSISAQTTSSNTVKPYIIPSSYFPLK